jgi:hypothetical protein
MTLQQLRLILISSLVLGLAGCQYFPRFEHSAKVTPAPVDAPRRSSAEAENVLYARAVAAIDQRDYGLALDILQLARQDRANDPRVLTAMGVVYDKLGRFDLSKRYYGLAEAADPGSKVVQIDRAYSAVLQQRHDTGRPMGPVVLAEASPVARWIPAAARPTPQLALKVSSPVLIGHPVRIQNDTGRAKGADLIQARLAGKGWRVVRATQRVGTVSPTSRLQYPLTAERVAAALARSLTFPVKLESCASCTRVELVIGTDAAPSQQSRPAAKARRG